MITMKNMTRWMAAVAAAALLSFAPSAQAQPPAATGPGAIHGHVQNAAGIAMNGGDVKLTTDIQPTETTKFKYDIPVDANGNFKLAPVDAGTYFAVFYKDGKSADFLPGLKVVSGQDLVADFDMSRKEYIDKMTPEEKQALEEYKERAGGVMAENAKIADANALLNKSRDAIKAKDFQSADTMMEQAVSAKPDEGVLWFTLGDAQTGLKKYADAATSYNKAISLNDAGKKPLPDLDAAADNNLGQAYAMSGKTTDAAAAYEAAAKVLPANAAMYYSNEAAVFFNRGDVDSALPAADKAIAADPMRADPYYIRASALIQKATVDKAGKIIAPPGCVEAYQKYLELAPTGAHAQDATDVLNSLGETIHSSYKAGKPGK